MLYITRSRKQFFINLFGYTYKFSRFTSTGRLLSARGLLEKNLKSSTKSTDILKAYINKFAESLSKHRTSVFLKPVTKSTIIFLKNLSPFILETASFVGLSKYYQTSTKKTHRIKKRIKKRLLRLA